MDNKYAVHVYDNEWKHNWNIESIGLVQFKNQVYEHIHKGKNQ